MAGRAQQTPGAILVVEDDFDIREAVLQILQDEGFAVLGAANGQEGMAALRERGRDVGLVLLDLMMPVVNGWQFRAEQLADPSLAKIPVVVMSADAGAVQKAASIEAVDCLRKPVQLERLLEVVRRHVR